MDCSLEALARILAGPVPVGEAFGMPLFIDPAMPPDTIELRTDRQTVRMQIPPE